jgi:hypothetical protein
MRQQYILVVLLVAASASQAQTSGASPTADVRAAAGCYAVTVGAWSPPDPNPAYHRVPPRIRLDTTPTSRKGGWVLSPNIAYPYHGAFPGTPAWSLSGDTMRLLWSNGFQTTSVTLVRTDSVWTGDAVAGSDAVTGAPPPRAHVTIRRELCS